MGIKFDDTFLKKEVASSDTDYMGKCAYGDIHITVKGLKNKCSSAVVIYWLPNHINKQYTVEFKDNSSWNLGIKDIKDKDGNIIFEGEYRKDSNFLYDKKGEPLMDDNIQILMNGECPYNANYNVSLKNVADLAYFSDDTIRGRYEFLIFAALLFIITAIDIKFPLLFFSTRHFLDVRNPDGL